MHRGCNWNIFGITLGEGGTGRLSAVTAIFLLNPNVVERFAILSSRTDSSLDDTCESFAVAVLPSREVGAVCTSCGVFGVGSSLGARKGTSTSSSSSVSWSFVLSLPSHIPARSR